MKQKQLITAISKWVGIGVLNINLAQAGGLITVDTVSDQPQQGLTTLREAVVLANAFDDVTIAFDPSLFSTPQTILLELGEIELNASMHIVGPGPELLAIDANDQSRIFNIQKDGGTIQAELSGMTLINGNTTGPGGCINSSEILKIRELVIRDCHANQNGGGVHSFNTGDLLIENSSLINNISGNDGGGLYHQNGLNNMIINSTFFGNQADRFGGGFNTSQAEEVDVVNSTFSHNQAPSGAGMRINNSTRVMNSTIVFNVGTGIHMNQINIQNSIIAGNTAADCVFSASAFDNHNNLDSDGSCAEGATNHITVADAQLEPLNYYGGPTKTYRPQVDSAAVDAGDELFCVESDQRGQVRPQDGDGDNNAVCDIGAVELAEFEDVVFINGFD